MTERKDRWEDESSQQGFGLVQDLLGIPNDARLTRGEMVLQQNERVARAVESIAARTTSEDQRIIVTHAPGYSEQLERTASLVEDALERQRIHAMEMMHAQRMQDTRRRKETQEKSNKLMLALSAIYAACLDTADGVEEINDQLDDTNYQLENANSQLGNIGSILVRVEQNLSTLNSGQSGMSEHMEGIKQMLQQHQGDTKAMLKALLEFGIQEASKEAGRHEETHGLIRLTAKQIQEVFVTAIQRLVFAICIIDQNIQHIGKDILGAVNRANDIGVRVLDGIARIHDETAAIKRATSDQTAAITSAAGNWLEIQANQYLEQGKKLLANNHVDEAIKAFKRAVKSDSCNAEAHRLLGQAYIKKQNTTKAKEHLSVAASFVKTSEELTNVNITLLRIAAHEKDYEAIITLACDVVLSNPALFCYEQLAEIPAIKSVKALIFEALIDQAEGNSTILALCAVELIDVNPGESKLALDRLLKNGDLDHQYSIDPEVWEKFEDAVPRLTCNLKQYASPDQLSQLPTRNIWWLIKIFISEKRAISEARSMLVWMYKNNNEIAPLARNHQFEQIAKIITQNLGSLATEVCKFGEIPREVRQYIK